MFILMLTLKIIQLNPVKYCDGYKNENIADFQIYQVLSIFAQPIKNFEKKIRFLNKIFQHLYLAVIIIKKVHKLCPCCTDHTEGCRNLKIVPGVPETNKKTRLFFSSILVLLFGMKAFKYNKS